MKRLLSLIGVTAVVLLLASCDIAPFAANAVKLLNGFQSLDEKASTVQDTTGKGADMLKDGLASLRIVVDPGHGGIDSGAVGADSGIQEAELNLEVSKLVADLFKNAGADVLMTRETADVDYTSEGDSPKLKDMNSRAKLVKKQDPQILVSIHMNQFTDRSVSGAQVFFQKGSGVGEDLARCIQDTLNAEINGAKKRHVESGDYFMLRITENPCVIVECGFLSNSDDEKNLQDPQYREKLANCIFKGICTYLGVK